MRHHHVSIVVILAAFLFSSEVLAQLALPPNIEWQRMIGGSEEDYATSIEQTTDGGYIIAGYSESIDGDVDTNQGEFDYWIVKLSSVGDIMWQRSLGGSASDQAISIRQTTDGGYITAGVTFSVDGDIDTNKGYFDAWILKLSDDGEFQWQTTYGGSNSDALFSIQETIDSGYIATGFSFSNDGDVSGNNGDYDYWVVKLSKEGSIDWQRSLGGTGSDVAYSIEETADSGFVAAGYSGSNDGDVSGNIGDRDFWIVKLSKEGNTQWQKCLGGSERDNAVSIQQTTDGGYIVAGDCMSNDGNVSGNHGGSDFWIVKLSPEGSIEWQKTLGGSGEELVRSIQETKDGGFIAAGYTASSNGDVSTNHGGRDCWVVKLSVEGVLQWQRSLGGSGYDDVASIEQTVDGGYVLAGSSESNDGDVTGRRGAYDFWIVKLSPEGQADVETPLQMNQNLITSFDYSRGEVTIQFDGEYDRSHLLEIYDILGNLIMTIRPEHRGAGYVILSTTSWSVGTYIARYGNASRMFTLTH